MSYFLCLPYSVILISILFGSMRKVLIVDDSHLVQTMLRKELEGVDRSLRISQAANCEEAVDRFGSFEPDMVILDIELPDGSGIGLLERFKEDRPGLEVIMFTNYATHEFRKRCRELGADHFIDKSDHLGLMNLFR